MDLIVPSEHGARVDRRVMHHARPRSYPHVRTDPGVGPDLHPVLQLCGWMNDRGRMNLSAQSKLPVLHGVCRTFPGARMRRASGDERDPSMSSLIMSLLMLTTGSWSPGRCFLRSLLFQEAAISRR